MAMLETAGVKNDAIDLLTPRERECLRLVYEHLSSKEIGRRLGISKHTVDTHVDKARQRLGAQDRYDAARRVAAHERAAAIPTRSGPDANGIGAGGEFGLHPPRQEGSPNDTIQPGPIAKDRQPVAGSAPGQGFLAPDLADPADPGNADAALHLGTAGAAARRPVWRTGPGGDHPGAGLGSAQAGALEAAGIGAARGPVPRLDPDGRILPAGPLAWGGSGNALGPIARLGLILLIAIASAVAFGGVLAGLHALKDLA